MNPVAYVRPDKYVGYKINVDIPTANRCIEMLKDGGLDAHPNPHFDWIHDSFLILIRMFPNGCPPTVLVSQNARYDPHFHVRVGSILRPLREEGYLIIGSGGAVHNLYRNIWTPMLKYRDNFAMPTPPGDWALDFRQAFEDAMTKHSGPDLRKAVTRLMKHPKFRDAHGTDEHFIPATFVAGAAGDIDDSGIPGRLIAEDWELVSWRWSHRHFDTNHMSRQTCVMVSTVLESGRQSLSRYRLVYVRTFVWEPQSICKPNQRHRSSLSWFPCAVAAQGPLLC